jgi:hypothetical protein
MMKPRSHRTTPWVAAAGLLAALGLIPALAQKPLQKDGKAPGYRSESPLPKGWPAPGPYERVVRKKCPAYRSAFTESRGANSGFMKLFRHIKAEDIPMTAPVEMQMESGDKGLEMVEMGFFYQSTDVGSAGPKANGIEVRDVPAAEVLSYAWLGGREKADEARKLVDAELARLGLKAKGYRLLGYNSPMMPRGKRTHELQAVLP